jgi:hypothetical protein
MMDRHPTMNGAFLYSLMSVLFSMNLHAQDTLKHVTFDVGAGFTFPAGQLANHAKTGFNFVASGGPRFNSRFSVSADFGLHSFNAKNSLPSPSGVDLSLGSVVRVWTLTANPTFQFLKLEKLTSYTTAGYGLYNRKLEIPFPGPIAATACDEFWNVCVSNSPTTGATVSGNINPYTGGYNVGGGVNFGTRTKFFVEVRYHHMFTTKSPTEFIPLTFGIRW